MKTLRYYQHEKANEAVSKLALNGFVYLSMEVRTGKTVTALQVAKLYGVKSVLFITKIKAIQSIKNDYNDFGFDFELTVVNTESLHKVTGKYDLVISDEHHKYGAFPKPSKGYTTFKSMFYDTPVICLSGTPFPESFSQVYHQFSITKFAPYSGFKNFYAWSKQYVTVKQKKVSYGFLNDYSNANKDQIFKDIQKYMVTFTQKEAGFETEIKENFLHVEMQSQTYKMIERLERDLVIEGKEEVILADTSVKLLQKVHQMYSGTVKFESGNAMVFDDSKALFIKEYFQGKKLAIFYKFKAELVALKMHLDITDDIEEFNNTSKSIALQIVSGREGINLSKADYLVYYNLDFSAVSYWQSRDRMTTIDRLKNDVYWIFSNRGIEDQIYKAVSNKKDFTTAIYKAWKVKDKNE